MRSAGPLFLPGSLLGLVGHACVPVLGRSIVLSMSMEPYDPSQGALRCAKDLTLRAAELREQFERSGDIERRNREADHCLGVVIMTHSSLEAWINQVLERAGGDQRHSGQSWDARWCAPWITSPLPEVETIRTTDAGDASEALADLNALRN